MKPKCEINGCSKYAQAYLFIGEIWFLCEDHYLNLLRVIKNTKGGEMIEEYTLRDNVCEEGRSSN